MAQPALETSGGRFLFRRSSNRIRERLARGFRDRFLYNGDGESLFDIVQKYTTQKQVLGRALSDRIQQMSGKPLKALDIGTSKGHQLAITLGNLRDHGYPHQIHWTLLEPDPDSVAALRIAADTLKSTHGNLFRYGIEKKGWEQFDPDSYDLITATHVIYHFNPDQFNILFGKMVEALAPGGKLLISAREGEGNPVYDMIKGYKSLLPGERFNDISIEDVMSDLEAIVQRDSSLSIIQKPLSAHVILPFDSDLLSAQKLMAFFLQRPSWKALPKIVREDVMRRTEHEPDVELLQKDRLVVISRNRDS